MLLEKYIDKLNPRLIIYEVYPVTFSIDGVESALDLVSNDKIDWAAFEMILEVNNIKTYNTFIYSLINDFLGSKKAYIEPLKKDGETYIAGGYVEKDVSYYKPSEFEEKEILFNTEQFEAFEEIVSLINSRKINLVLIYAPIPIINYTSYSNNKYFDSIMNTYGNYYNYNEIIHLNDSIHFYDSDHLNQRGVKIFNEELIENLKNKITNKDH